MLFKLGLVKLFFRIGLRMRANNTGSDDDNNSVCPPPLTRDKVPTCICSCINACESFLHFSNVYKIHGGTCKIHVKYMCAWHWDLVITSYVITRKDLVISRKDLLFTKKDLLYKMVPFWKALQVDWFTLSACLNLFRNVNSIFINF